MIVTRGWRVGDWSREGENSEFLVKRYKVIFRQKEQVLGPIAQQGDYH
jgi:hypothetical protein